jgi:hypothetical protein
MNEIWRKMIDVRNARSSEMRRRMEAYDREVYLPAVQAIQAECEALGHKPGGYKTNGLGWSWTECQFCGARVEQWHDGDEPPAVTSNEEKIR